MSSDKRAILYITRKRGKTLLLFLLLLIVSSFVLTGMSVKKAADSASLNLRENQGGSFSLEIDAANNSDQYKSDGNGNYVYAGGYITNEMIQDISNIDGVKAYNIKQEGCSDFFRPDGSSFTFINYNDWMNDDFMAGWENIGNLYGESNTEYDSSFSGGSLELLEGRHLNENDKHVALVHKAFADENNLQLGDKILLQMNDEISTEKGSSKYKETVEIIGIYHSLAEQSGREYELQYGLAENTLYIDLPTYDTLFTWVGAPEYTTTEFYVNDPKEIDSIMAKANDLDSIDWSKYKMSVNETSYQKSAEALQNLDTLMTVMIVIIMIASIAVIILILSMWLKSRKHETGILLSTGTGKVNIIAQHMTEILLIAVLAFGLSYFTSQLTAQGIGNALLQQQTAGQEQEEDENPYTGGVYFEESGTNFKENVISSIDVEVSSQQLVILYIGGLLLIIVSVLIATVPVLQAKPKDILSSAN